jgi:hypothetical protein
VSLTPSLRNTFSHGEFSWHAMRTRERIHYVIHNIFTCHAHHRLLPPFKKHLRTTVSWHRLGRNTVVWQ